MMKRLCTTRWLNQINHQGCVDDDNSIAIREFDGESCSAAAETPHRLTSTPSRDAYRTEIELQKGVDPAQWQNIPKYIHPGKKKSLCVSVGGLWRRPGQSCFPWKIRWESHGGDRARPTTSAGFAPLQNCATSKDVSCGEGGLNHHTHVHVSWTLRPWTA